MAELKKYLDTAALEALVTNIKAEDAEVLAAAKAHAEGLSTNYDAAGAAATAESNAKSYTDTEVAKANAAAATAQTQADKGVADAATADGKAVAAQAAADKAQGEVDQLETYVGTFTHDTAKSVVEYVDAKTAGIASESAMTELAGRVTTVEGKVSTIEGDYLKASDRTALEGLITAEADARVAADEAIDERLVEVEAFFKLAEGEQLDTALDTLKEIQTYLDTEGAAADQMVLDIAANAKAIEDETSAREQAITDLDTAYKAADEALDLRVDELEKLLGDADGSVKDQIADAIAAEVADRKAADTALDNRLKTVEAIEHHTHDNKAVLDGITAELIAAWSAAEQNAKDYADGLNTTMQSTVDGIDDRVEALETASATHALASDLNAAVERISANETAIAANTSAINSFTAITSTEVDALFA